MLRWTLIFLVIAIIAAIFGFGNIAAGATSIARILFFIFIVLFLLAVYFLEPSKKEKLTRETKAATLSYFFLTKKVANQAYNNV